MLGTYQDLFECPFSFPSFRHPQSSTSHTLSVHCGQGDRRAVWGLRSSSPAESQGTVSHKPNPDAPHLLRPKAGRPRTMDRDSRSSDGGSPAKMPGSGRCGLGAEWRVGPIWVSPPLVTFSRCSCLRLGVRHEGPKGAVRTWLSCDPGPAIFSFEAARPLCLPLKTYLEPPGGELDKLVRTRHSETLTTPRHP